jgi:8-oxo-dGTP pyrophosphatase MutT (NUDIX family)
VNESNPSDRERRDFAVQLERALCRTPSVRLPDEECDRRAAVILLLAPEPGSVLRTESEGALIHQPVSALFVLRAAHDGDPWSGHVALPGGRVEDEDTDLVETAMRETREETAVDLARDAVLAPLDEIHPRSVHLPSIGVTPYVGWVDERPEIRENHEIAGHIWVPLPVLRAPESRSTLALPGRPDRVFPTIEYAGAVIWGLTHAIVEDFLRRVAPQA